MEKEYANDDDEHEVLEMHVNADVPGFEDPNGIKLPYIITIDKYSSTKNIINFSFLSAFEFFIK